ncbi:MAG: sensor histidine kinase [Polaribacter sp.]|uniref:tetratricopeptide repeat-containing sensor histidine kinase n=1 Tax=Polaribacter sp. TaxID=1920175 RepID=UPI003266AAC6
MKVKIVIFFLFFTICSLESQSIRKKIDSLKQEVKILKDTSLIQTLNEISWLYKRIDIDSSLIFSKKALLISKKLNNDKLTALAYNNLGTIYESKSLLDSALFCHKRSFEIKTKIKDTIGIANSYNNFGIIYDLRGEYLKSLQNYFKALEVYETSNADFDRIPMVFVNIGIVYKKQKNYKKVLEFYKKAIKIYKDNNHKIGTVITTGNIASVYLELKDYEKAIKNSLEAKRGYKDLSYEVYLPYMDHNIAIAKDGLEEYLDARKIYNSIIIEFEKQNALFELSDAKINLAKNYTKTNNLHLAIKELKEVLIIIKKNKFKEKELTVLKLLSKNQSNLNSFKEAYNNLITYDIKKDSVFEQEKMKAILELETKYRTEKKEKELLETRTEKAETELKLSKTINWIYILIGGLTLAILLFFAISQRNKRKTQEEIVAQKEQGFKAIIDAQEEERSKMARELHDGVVQQIGSVILKSRNILSKMNLLQTKESQELLESLENSSQDLRTISHQMMPRALKELGIIPALNDLLEGSLPYSKVKYTLEHFNIAKRLPQKIEVTLYRITQELINNIIKHSKATDVSVQLFNTNNTVVLIIEDNGIGFSSEKKEKGIGLLNISSRLDIVNGEVHFEPSPKSGTLVTIKIPL